MGRVGAVMVAAVLVLASATAAIACSCVRYPNAKAQFDQAEVMFVGQAQGGQTTAEFDGGSATVTRFKVARVLKGQPASVLAISHGELTGGMCGIRFQRGRTYTIVAYRAKGRLWTNSCSMPQFPLSDFEALAKRR